MFISSLSDSDDWEWIWGLHRQYMKEFIPQHDIEELKKSFKKISSYVISEYDFDSFDEYFKCILSEQANEKLLEEVGVELMHGGFMVIDKNKLFHAKMSRDFL